MADFDGFYSLDLKEKEVLALTRKIDEYTDVGKIKQDTFKEIEVPITKKNRLLLGQIGNPSALNEDNNKIFNIQILCGDYTYPSQGLQVVGLSEDSASWECILFGEVAGWAADIRELKLNTLDLGSEICDDTFVRFTLPAQHLYTDTSYPVFAPACNYGKHFINHNLIANSANSQMVFNSYRYWYSPLALMRALFCAVGYELIAPILETEEWRRTWIYLLDPNFETINQADIANRGFERHDLINRPLNLTNDSAILFSTVISDPGSHSFILPGPFSAGPDGLFYSAGVIGNFKTSGTIRFTNPLPLILLPTDPENITIKVTICKSDRYGQNTQYELIDRLTVLASQEFFYTNPIAPGGVLNFNWNISTGDVKVYQHELVFVRFEITAYLVESGTGIVHDGIFVRQNSFSVTGGIFLLEPTTQVIEKGDTLDFASMIHADYTGMDLVQGIAHLHNLKIQTDVVGKKIYMYPEFEIDMPISGIQEGFFNKNTNNPLEATDKIQVKSLEQGFLNTDLKRNVYLKFKDSTDGYIGGLNLEQELHSKKIDLGDKYANGDNEIENPFFEPMQIAIDETLGVNYPLFLPTYELHSANLIPFLWESEASANEQPALGYKFAPRIGIAYEESFRIEIFNIGLNPSLDMFVYEDTLWAQANCFAQIYPVLPITVVFYPTSSPATPTYCNLGIVYGRGIYDEITPDLWELVYRRSVNQAYFNIALRLMADIDLTVFSALSFRQKWHLVYNSLAWGQIDIYCRLSYIQDYVIGGNMVTPIELIPDSNNFLNCG
jgi:hypothetical protein